MRAFIRLYYKLKREFEQINKQENCPHDYKVVMKHYVFVYTSRELKYKTLYCPICEKEIKLRTDEANVVINKQEERKQYEEDYQYD